MRAKPAKGDYPVQAEPPQSVVAKDEINVPIALSAFRDKPVVQESSFPFV